MDGSVTVTFTVNMSMGIVYRIERLYPNDVIEKLSYM